jgi:3-hydroxyisobutyrate dehydrogenase
LTFAAKNGLDLQKTIDAVAGGAAGSWQLANLGPRMVKGDFAPGFMIELQQKDLRLVMESAGQSGAALPASALVHQLFTAAQSAGRGRDGTQALYTVLRRLSGESR